MRAVNLLPRETGSQRKLVSKQNLPALVGSGLGVVVTGALALSFLHAAGAVSKARAQLGDVTAQLAATPVPPPQEAPQNTQLAGEQSARIAAVSAALGGRLAWDRILREFSLVLPDDVSVSTLGMTAPAAGSEPSPTAFTIAGTTYSHDAVARLLARLALVPELNGVALTSSSRQGASSGPATVQFTITAGINAAPGAAAATPPVPVPVPVPTDTTVTTTGASS